MNHPLNPERLVAQDVLNKTAVSFSALMLLTSFVCRGADSEEIELAKAAEEVVASRHQAASVALVADYVLCDQISYSFEGGRRFPFRIRVRNPFENSLDILTRDGEVAFGGAQQLHVEFYDAYLKEWRRPSSATGTFARAEMVTLKPKQEVTLLVDRDFGDQLIMLADNLMLSDPVKYRLVLDFGCVVLRGNEVVGLEE